MLFKKPAKIAFVNMAKICKVCGGKLFSIVFGNVIEQKMLFL